MKEKIDKIITKILEDVKRLRDNAAYSGSWGDNGAGQLEQQVKFYEYGRKGIIPPEWKEYEKQTDPEYEEFLRLNEKFKK